jgi:hypothetical protein
MNTPIRFALCALVATAVWVPVRAADKPATTGRVLVLDNEHTLEGDIECDGAQYRVRRPLGETWVPADKVLCLCNSREEAYAFLRTRANLQDPDERLRLARWCHLYGLRTQAVAEATAAVELRPNSAEGRQLLHGLQRAAAAAAALPPRPPETKGHDEPEPAPSALPAVDCSAEALGLFSTRVQPILMNTCVTCHSSGRAGSFRLARAFEDGTVNRRATQQNLVAVLAQVNLERPTASPLLLKAVSIHGEAGQPPLKNRHTPAFHALEEWVRLAVASNRQPQEQPLAAAPEPKLDSPPSAPPVGPPAEAVSAPAAPVRPAGPTSTTPPSGTAPALPAATPPTPRTVPQPAAEAGPADPFDPVIFNRQAQAKP